MKANGMKTNTQNNTKVNETIGGVNFFYTTIPSAQMKIGKYQRKVNQPKIKRIVKHFDPNKFKAVLVNQRDDNYYIVDGQHSAQAWEDVYGDRHPMPARVIHVPYEEEVRLYNTQYSDCSKLTALDHFNAEVEIEDEAQAIQKICSDCHLTIGKGKAANNISAIVCLKEMYETLGRTITINVLNCLRDGWVNNPHAFDNYILQGMTVFFNTYGKLINLNVLKKKLKCITPEIIKAEADSYPSNFLKKRCNRYAYAIFNLYNKGIRNGKLEDFVALCKR